MPFFGKFSCYSFTIPSVRQNAPRRPGVYGISNAKGWLLIGVADDLQATLHAHLCAVGTPLRSMGATGFTCEECPPADCQRLLNRLVADLHPALNSPSTP